jgi:N-methylhydantoinase A/oxoprolinase/acetone carboxylase beta subunit
VEIGRIPYLNGGLFDEHEIEKNYKNISIEDKAFETLERQGNEDLALDGIAPKDRRFIRSADVRYSGQVYSLNVQVPGGVIVASGVKKIIQRFNSAHESIYGFKVEREPVEIVNLRCQAMGLRSSIRK